MLKIRQAFAPKAVWLLTIPALLLLGMLDWPLVKTLLQWSVFALVLAGVSIVLSMLIFPQIDLEELVNKAAETPQGSATLAAAVILFLGVLFYTLVFWAKT